MAAKFDFRSLERPFEADWPVTVSEPDDGGVVKESTFMARLRLLTDDQVKEIVKDDPDGRALYRAYFIGFGRSESETFSPELLETMLGHVFMRVAINAAYQSFCTGVAAKNSVRPPA